MLELVQSKYVLQYISIIVPMGVFNVVGSLQNLESAEAAGDRYDTFPSLLTNGIGSVVASLFGSCFPTTIYIGHPGLEGYWRQNRIFDLKRCLRSHHLPKRIYNCYPESSSS